MSRSNNTPLLVSLVACIVVVVAAMMTAVLIAVQRPVVVVMQPPGDGGGVADGAALLPLNAPVAAPIAAASTAPPPAAAQPAAAQPAAGPTTPAPLSQQPPEIRCVRVAAVPALDDLFAAGWEAAPVAEIPLQPQQTAPPMLAEATVSHIRVQALRDERRIAWRLSWDAPSPQYRSDSGEFPDGVALQFQMVDGAPFTMGAKDMPVRILHWKSVWQKDVDEGFQDLAQLYPNAWNDLYWFVEETGPTPVARIVASPEARQFQVALSAGNPMVNFDRKVPLEELVAEGFGTATNLPDSPSQARGLWKDGRWTVIIDRPLAPADPLSARLLQSESGAAISLAVWDGTAGNRGGLKHWCAWIPMRIEQ